MCSGSLIDCFLTAWQAKQLLILSSISVSMKRNHTFSLVIAFVLVITWWPSWAMSTDLFCRDSSLTILLPLKTRLPSAFFLHSHIISYSALLTIRTHTSLYHHASLHMTMLRWENSVSAYDLIFVCMDSPLIRLVNTTTFHVFWRLWRPPSTLWYVKYTLCP